MAHSADCPQGRSQHFTFFRRELLRRLASVALLSAASQYKSVKLPEKYPPPAFQIGDKVADYWTDEFGKESIEYGEVIGICWHPHKQAWGCLINWTSGSPDFPYYPCFDENLVVGGDLRLVSRA